MAFLRSIVLAVAIAISSLAGSINAARIDGGEDGWDSNRWYVQVDGVMGGKSSGNMQFLSNDSVMKFTGDIVTDGGGFSSVRRRIDLDLSNYAGVVITLEADVPRRTSSPPTGLHLQFDDKTSYYDFSSAFAVPLSSDASGPVVTSVYLPMESFDRGTRIGRQCRNNCRLNTSQIGGMSVYVLFQEGSFDVRLRSIEAVRQPRSFPSPVYENLQSANDVVSLLRSTISSGGGVYDYGYQEICIAMYWSVLNTILSSQASAVSDPVRAVICAGLQEVEDQMEVGDSKVNIAWNLRYTMDAVIADINGSSRTTSQSWLPTASEAASMEASCEARTSAATGPMYDPATQNILVSDSKNQEKVSLSDSISDQTQPEIEEEGKEPLLSDSTDTQIEPISEVEIEQEESMSVNEEKEVQTISAESSEFNSGSLSLFASGFGYTVLGTLLSAMVHLVE